MVTMIENSVHLVGETTLIDDGLQGALDELGVSDWRTNAETGAEEMIEFAGRLCYLSFGTALNPNITRTREGNKNYIGNVLNSRHGSVIEHGVCNFACLNVTPVFTHELVRHRAGTAFSQTSGRFVRLDDIHFMWPKGLTDAQEGISVVQANTIMERGMSLLHHMEKFQKEVAELLSLDEMGSFSAKKKITSAMRRFAPYGVRTHIMFSANHRAIRHMISVRNSVHAEEEPDNIFGSIATLMKDRYPAIYQDMSLDDTGRWVFENDKV